jgi:phosphopantetheinyl transferase
MSNIVNFMAQWNLGQPGPGCPRGPRGRAISYCGMAMKRMRLFPPAGLERERVLVRVLEHEAELEDRALLDLCEWTREDRASMWRFRQRQARTSWCLARWLLRASLIDCGVDGEAIPRMELGRCGKPFIRGLGLRFNWSHAAGCVALALAFDREVGVDIEGIEGAPGDYVKIAASCFSREEAAWVGGVEDEEASRRFLALFVQKEAGLKAAGQGLGASLAGAPAALALPPSAGPGWTLAEIDGRGHYFLAAVAEPKRGAAWPPFQLQLARLER